VSGSDRGERELHATDTHDPERPELKYIVFKLSDDNKEIVVDKSSNSASYDDFINDLPADTCRYAIYDFEYQKGNDGTRNKLCFFAWCAKPYSAMRV